MKDDNVFMGWNPPPTGSEGPKNNRPDVGSDENSDRNPKNDPWERQRRRQSGGDGGIDDIVKNVVNVLKDKTSRGGTGGSSFKRGSTGLKALVLGILAVCLGVYIFTGFYTVREAERGVLLRFGKFYEVVNPGLQWKFNGIDKVYTVDIEQVRAIQSSGSMLTEDENVVIVEMDVQYHISDPVQYLFSVRNPDNSLMEATDSALRYVVGHTLMDDILTSGRERVRQDTRELLNSIIEPYKMGLSIVDVNFLPARAPDEVKEAFDDAIAAQEDEQRFKREAEAYANEVLPRAEGRVQRIRQEAEAYRSQVVLDAQGEVSRFEKILPEYNAAPDITRTRLYLETMQEVLGSSSKIILDTPKGSNPVLYLPLPTQQAQTLQQAQQQALPPVKSTSVNSEPYYGGTNTAHPKQDTKAATRSVERSSGYGYSQGGR